MADLFREFPHILRRLILDATRGPTKEQAQVDQRRHDENVRVRGACDIGSYDRVLFPDPLVGRQGVLLGLGCTLYRVVDRANGTWNGRAEPCNKAVIDLYIMVCSPFLAAFFDNPRSVDLVAWVQSLF